MRCWGMSDRHGEPVPGQFSSWEEEASGDHRGDQGLISAQWHQREGGGLQHHLKRYGSNVMFGVLEHTQWDVCWCHQTANTIKLWRNWASKWIRIYPQLVVRCHVIMSSIQFYSERCHKDLKHLWVKHFLMFSRPLRTLDGGVATLHPLYLLT